MVFGGALFGACVLLGVCFVLGGVCLAAFVAALLVGLFCPCLLAFCAAVLFLLRWFAVFGFGLVCVCLPVSGSSRSGFPRARTSHPDSTRYRDV